MRTPRRSTTLLTGGALLAGSATVGVAFAPLAGAQSFTVTTTDDSGAGSLRQAIIDANAHAGTDTITFAPTVSGTITLASDLTPIVESVVITGPGEDRLTIDGSRRYSGFTQSVAQDTTISLELSGVTLRRLRAETGAGLGAVAVLKGDLTLRDTTVIDSGTTTMPQTYTTAPVLAGSFTAGTPTGTVLLERVTITGNHAYQSPNGYTAMAGAALLSGASVTIVDSSITDNSADFSAGAFLIGGRVSISNSTVADNRAPGAFGGLTVRADTVSISSSRITGNSALTHGGLSVISRFYRPSAIAEPSITVFDSLIADNTAEVGSVNYLEAATVSVDRTTITGNRSAEARTDEDIPQSALAVLGTATIRSSTITNNSGLGVTASGRRDEASCGTTASVKGPATIARSRRLEVCALGPAVRPPAPVSSLLVSHSTIADNSMAGISARVTAIEATSTPAAADSSSSASTTPPTTLPTISVDQSIVAGNGGTKGLDIDAPFTARFSLVQKPFATHTDGAGGGNVFGVDPQLQPLTWYSRTGAVRPILWGSPAWNTGDPAFTPPPATDQTGAPREVEIIDMGAYEVQTTLDLAAPKFTG